MSTTAVAEPVYQNTSTPYNNCSYLSDTKYQAPKKGVVFLSPKRQLELKQQYEDMNRDYEMKSNYGLSDPYFEMNHVNSMSSFGNDIFRQIEQYQLTEMKSDAASKLKNNEDAKALIKPAGVVGGAYMFGTGKPMTFNVADGSNVVTRTSFRDEQASLGFVSQQVDTSIAVSQRSPSTYQSGMITPIDPTQHDDRYKLSISRPIAALQLTPSAYYGSTSTVLMLGLTKQVTTHVSVRYSHNVPMDPSISDYHYTEDMVVANYGITF